MLTCSFCNSALAITLLSSLSTKASEKVCNAYREKLVLAHDPNCPFKIEGEQFLRESQQNRHIIIPVYMASVLPQEVVKLVEHPVPRSLLRLRVQQLESKCPTSWTFPKLQISNEITDVSTSAEEDDPIKSACQLLETTQTPAILSILGWEHTSNKEDETGRPVVCLGCRLCYSWMELTLEEADSSPTNDDKQPEKRRKLASPRYRNPLQAHRHYCPIICGFPESLFAEKKPLWKSILSRLLQQQKVVNETGGPEDYTVDKIQQILRSAIAPKRIDLTSEIDEEDMYSY